MVALLCTRAEIPISKLRTWDFRYPRFGLVWLSFGCSETLIMLTLTVLQRFRCHKSQVQIIIEIQEKRTRKPKCAHISRFGTLCRHACLTRMDILADRNLITTDIPISMRSSSSAFRSVLQVSLAMISPRPDLRLTSSRRCSKPSFPGDTRYWNDCADFSYIVTISLISIFGKLVQPASGVTFLENLEYA